RAPARSSASFTSAASSSSPDACVIDDDPIFTTARPRDVMFMRLRPPALHLRAESEPARAVGSAPDCSRGLLVRELDRADAHEVTIARARARERPLHSHAPQLLLHVGNRVGR